MFVPSQFDVSLMEKHGKQEEDQAVDVRIGVIGNVDSGKSTLIGVLTSGDLDDGRGSARTRVFRHQHEETNGRTSCISQHILGFDASSAVVHQTVAASAAPAAKTKSWQSVVKKSTSVMTFIDLAGHEKYLKTTIAGLTGSYPHYACVLVGANMGVSKMTKEHLGIAVALEIPLFVVVTKVDIAPENVLKRTLKQLYKILRHPQAGKMPIMMRKEEDVATCLGDTGILLPRICPIFLCSSVKGTNIELLTTFLSKVHPTKLYFGDSNIDEKELHKDVNTEIQIDETFVVTGVGTVVSGVVQSGCLVANTQLLLGPFSDGAFHPVVIRSIHVKRTPVASAKVGVGCAIAIRAVDRKHPIKRSQIRRGMALVHPHLNPLPVHAFKAEVLILHHPTTIKNRYQSVIHCGSIRQSAELLLENDNPLRTGDKALITFVFLYQPEFMHAGSTIIFREGSTKGIGRVTEVFHGKVSP